ncbi:MAG: M48 family metalloprotease, partial [Steroidobacteraceae bacterium]
HSLRSLIKQMGMSGAWALVSGDLAGAAGARAAQQMMSFKFSRDAEREADAVGFEALVGAGINPAGMPAFFAMLNEGSAAPPELLSTHPSSQARRQALAGRLQQLGSQSFTSLPYQPWPPED